MRKSEAIEAMKNGKVVKHKHFGSDEWMYYSQEEHRFVFEDGVRCPVDEFWRFRQDICFSEGWEVLGDISEYQK